MFFPAFLYQSHSKDIEAARRRRRGVLINNTLRKPTPACAGAGYANKDSILFRNGLIFNSRAVFYARYYNDVLLPELR